MLFFSAEVALTVDAKGLPSQLAKAKNASTRAATDIQRSFDRMAKRVRASMIRAAKYVTAGFTAMGVASIKWASDVQESEHLFEFAMGAMADSTREWSEELATSLKRNQFEIRRTVATLTVLMTTMGFTSDKAAEMSQNLVQFSYDMAALRNMRPEEVFEKLKSGLVGFSRPMRALGISTIDTSVKMYALAQGIGTVGEELTEQEKMMARYGIMMETATRLQGYAISEIDFAVSVYRSLKDQIRLTAIALGEEYLPAITKVGIALREWLIKNQERVVEQLKEMVDVGVVTVGFFWDYKRVLGLTTYALFLLVTSHYLAVKAITALHVAIWVFHGTALLGVGTLASMVVQFKHLIWEIGIMIGVAGQLTLGFTALFAGIITIALAMPSFIRHWKGATDAINEYYDAREREWKLDEALRRRGLKVPFPVPLPPGYDSQRILGLWEPPDLLKLPKVKRFEDPTEEWMEKWLAEDVALTAARKEQAEMMLEHQRKMAEEGGALWEMAENKKRMEYETTLAVVTQTMEAEAEEKRKLAERIAARAEDFAMRFRDVMASGLEQSMRDWDNWGEHIMNMLEELYWKAVRMAFLEPVAGVLAKGLTAAMSAVLGEGIFETVLPTPTPIPVKTQAQLAAAPHGAQYGGIITKTGLIMGHKGEVFSGVGKGDGGLTINVNNDNLGMEIDVSEAEMSILGDQRIVDVFVTRAGTDGPLRRAIKSAAK